MTKTYVMTGLIEKVCSSEHCRKFSGMYSAFLYHRRCNRLTRISGTCLRNNHRFRSSTAVYRYMGLNDLLLEIKQDPSNFLGDESMESKVLKQVLALVEDKISEVKNQAVKW